MLSRRAFGVLATAGLGACATQAGGEPAADVARFSNVRALVFDVFGTVVDWRTSVARETKAMLAPKGYDLDWPAFASRWRAQYDPAMAKVRNGQRPFVILDQLHREMLDPVLAEYKVEGLSEQEKVQLSLVWRRLDPWPDTVAGLTRLKRGFILAPLSNGNIALMVEMARRAGLPWDAILGAETAQAYKPDPRVYDSAPRFLQLEPAQVMMVAAHPGDLRAAAVRGLRTAYVHRPNEYGPAVQVPRPKPGEFEAMADSFIDLAHILGA